mmetsp:Transcript_27590/g.51529  ORF Transcript_27590/g.51529 Transcript_27590/m.51529 type:complete len:765 (+) Transcript_27590:247-2541(+)
MMLWTAHLKRRTVVTSWRRMFATKDHISERMCSAEDELCKNEDLLLGELFKKSSRDREFFLQCEDSVRELVSVLHHPCKHSSKTLILSIQAISNLAKNIVLFSQLKSLGVSASLIQLLNEGPSAVRGKVALCLYQLHTQSIKNQHVRLPVTGTATLVDTEKSGFASTITAIAAAGEEVPPGVLQVDSLLAQSAVMQASVAPLLLLLRSHSSSSVGAPLEQLPGSERYSREELESALDALRRYCLRDTRVASAVIEGDALRSLVPLLFSGNELLVKKTLLLMTLLCRVESAPLAACTAIQKSTLIYSLLFVLKTHHAYNGGSNGKAASRGVESSSTELIRNSCLQILKRLAASGEHGDEGATIVHAGGLAVVLKIYDRILAASPANLHKAQGQRDQHSCGYTQRPPAPAPTSCQQFTVELLQALSGNEAAIRWLFEKQRYDIVFGFLSSGDETCAALVISEMWRVLQHLPVSSGDDAACGAGDDASGARRERAQHLAHLLLIKPPWVAALLDALSVFATDLTGRDSESRLSLQRQLQQEEAMCTLCVLMDFNDCFLAALLFDNGRHRALQTLVALAEPPAPPSFSRLTTFAPAVGDGRGARNTAPTSGIGDCEPREVGRVLEPPPYHLLTRLERCSVADNDGSGDAVKECCPSARVSALYALYRLSAYARNEKKPVQTFDLIWHAGAVPVLLRAFLNGDGGVDLQGRKYAALALAQLCEHSTSRNHLILTSKARTEEEAAVGLGEGINLLEMIEWFLQEEVYQKV